MTAGSGGVPPILSPDGEGSGAPLSQKEMMTDKDVIKVVGRLERAGLNFWLDGGWGVDALLGEQTRDHSDLDMVVELNRIDEIIALMATLGFEKTSTTGRRAWSWQTRATAASTCTRSPSIRTETECRQAPGRTVATPSARPRGWPARAQSADTGSPA